MNALLEWIISLSVQACALVMCVMAVRLAFKDKLSARVKYALWLIPAARLALPFDIGLQSDLSLMGALEALLKSLAPAKAAIAVNYQPASAAVNAVSAASSVPTVNAVAPAAVASVQPAASALSTSELILLVWLIGAALSLGYAAFVNMRFFAAARREREYLCKKADLSVYMLKGAASPCLAGVIKPYILVNEAAARDCGTLSFAVLHEEAHCKNGDNIWALARSLICCVYWFNPLVWFAAAISRRDCELACDERVMRGFDDSERERYGMALISLIKDAPRIKLAAFSASNAMTGSKRAMKARIKRIASRQRLSKATTAVALTLLLMLSAFACAAPKPAPTEPNDSAAPVTTDAPSGTAEPKADAEPAAEPEFDVKVEFPSLEIVTAGGNAKLEAGQANPELAQVMEDCVFDSLVRSAAWPSVDLEKPYMVFEQHLSIKTGEETHKYYVFMKDGTPCLQGGSMYTIMSDKVFERLLETLENTNADSAKAIVQTLRELNAEPPFDVTAYTQADGQAVAEQAKLLIGKKHALGGSGPDSFDMSGLVYYALNQAGVAVERMSALGYYQMNLPSVSEINELLPGDIILFSFDSTNIEGSELNGCAIYVGDGDMVIASSSAGEVRRTSVTQRYFKDHFWGGLRCWQ